MRGNKSFVAKKSRQKEAMKAGHRGRAGNKRDWIRVEMRDQGRRRQGEGGGLATARGACGRKEKWAEMTVFKLRKDGEFIF